MRYSLNLFTRTTRQLSALANKMPRHLQMLVLALAVVFIFIGVQWPATSSALTNGGSMNTLGAPITENFDTLATSGTANTWTDNTTLVGWYSQFELTPTNPTTYRADAGSSNTGAIYSYGTGTNTERAFGSVASGTPGTIFNAVKLTNNTGSTITSLDISYIGEQWRNGGNTSAQQLDFQYQVASPGTITDANTPTTGWIDFDSLDFVSPTTGATAAALDGNAAANRTAKSATLTVTISAGQEIWLRWKDINDSGNDHGLAIDDLSVTPQGAGGGGGSLSLTCTPSTFSEGAGAGASTCTVTRTGSTASLLVVNLMSSDTTEATVSAPDIGIPIGQASTTFTLDAVDDVIVDGTQTVTITASASGFTPGTFQVMVTDNDTFTCTPTHTIAQIQGSGTTSPVANQTVTTSGIVTGVKSNGFFIQMPSPGDGDPNTSDGVFVFTSSAPPAAAAVGNSVCVSGMVQEFIPSSDPLSPPATEIAGTPTVNLLSTGNPLPAPITLTSADTGSGGVNQGILENLEKYEGMRVTVTSLTVIAPTQGTVNEPNATSTSNGVFYGVITGVARPFREPGIQANDPVPSGSGVTIPPVPRFDANPERLRVDSDGLTGAAQLEVTAGATIANVTGPLDYAFRTYTILPDPGTLTQASVVGNVSVTPLPAPGAGEFTIASFNMERFFDTVADGNGAPTLTATAFANRLNKASLAIRNVLRFPDILGVEEMENITTLQAVANKINNDAVANAQPNPMYVAYLVEGNDVGGIDVGFLVKTAVVAGATPRVTVNAVVQEGLTTMYVNPNTGGMETLNDRPPLRLMAVVNHPDGRSFPITVIAIHNRSLSGVDDETVSGTGTEGARVRAKRQAQAEFVANLIQARQAADPNERIIAVGDYNAFQINDGYGDSIGTIKGTPSPNNQTAVANDGADLVNPDLTEALSYLAATDAYSFSFDGNAQVLDHELFTGTLVPFVNSVRIAHNNADFPETYRNDSNRPERLSDHDMPMIYLAFPTADLSIVKAHSGSFTLSGTGQYTITVSNNAAAGVTSGTITVTDNLPGNLTLASFSGTGWNCTGTGTANVSCTNAGPLAAGSSLPVLTLTVNVGAGTPTGTNSITNTASVATPGETSIGDNSSSDPTTVTSSCPTITISPSTGPTTQLPSGFVGLSYSQTFTAAPPGGSYTYSIPMASIPPGLMFNTSTGVLSGTPTMTGGFFFTVTATGFGTCTGSQNYVLPINPGCPSSFTVNDLGDAPDQTPGDQICQTASGACTLRAAIQEANLIPCPLITINFSVTGVINLGGALPNLAHNMIIDGPTAAPGITVRRDTGGNYTVITINGGRIVTINNLTITNGNNTNGGGILTTGSLTLNNSTLTGNTATSSGGGIFDAGGTTMLNNCTISGNMAQNGAGLEAVNTAFNPTTTITDSTITNNTATGFGGGMDTGSIHPVTIRGTIIAGNTAAIGPDVSNFGTLTSQGYNLIGNNSGSTFTAATGDQIGTSGSPINPLLGPLASNGGPTQTHALLAGSPALDKGNSFGLTTDQRLLPRPIDLGGIANATGGDGADIGAYEAANTAPTIMAVGVTRQQGSPVSNSTIANVSDAQQTGNMLTITVNGGAMATVNGVTVSNISANAAGVVTADVIAACGATNASFTLRVTDGNGLFSEATLNVTVTANTAPMLVYASPQNVTAGNSLNVTPTSTTDNGSITYSIVSVAPALSTAPTVNASGVVSITNAGPMGSHLITVRATDNCGLTTDASFTLNVNCQTITVTAPAVNTGTAGAPFSQTFTQSGGIGAITWSETGALPAGITLNSSTGVLGGTPTQTGTFPITVKATDVNGCMGTAGYTLTINCQTITVTAPATNTGTAGAPFSQTFTQSGGIGTITWSETGALPAGITLNSSTGVLSGTPTVTGTFPITVKAADANNCMGTVAYTLTINCQTITVTAPAINTGTAGAAFSQTFTQSGGIGTTTFSTVSTLPTGITLSSAGVLAGTPTVTGTFPITVKATDSNGCMGTTSYTLTINCQTITVNALAPNAGTAGTPFSQTFTQSGGIGTTTFSTASTLPTGLTLSSAGVLSGTPTQTGAFPIIVKATDTNGCMGTVNYTLTINCQTITVTAPATNTGLAGVDFSQTFTQVGGIGTTTFSTASTLPNGLTLTSAGVLVGTPIQTGTFPITVKATDANGCMGTVNYTLTIGCPTFTINPPTLPDATVGTEYRQTISAVASNTLTVTGGSLPPGLQLSLVSPGQSFLSGTPAASGTFTFTVTATGPGGCTGQRVYTLVVQPGTTTLLTSKIADPLVCTGPGNVVNVTATVTNSNATAQAATFTATLTPTLQALPGTCTANTGTCTVVSASTVTWMGTLAAGQTVTINYNAQVNDGVLPGTQLCVTSVATVANSLPATVTACGTVNCPTLGPGALPQTVSPMSDQKAGSVLIYNVYTSSTNPNQQNTRLSVTNTHPGLPAFVHLFFVDGTSCAVADSFLCLTANQTTSFLASDLDPGTTGYVVAVATDAAGCPINFNYLIGDEYVKFQSGHAANLGAEAITAIAGGLPACNTNSSTAVLNFDGVSYNVVPHVLAADNVPSRADGNDTLLILNRIGGNLGIGAGTLGTIFGIFYDDTERSLSFQFTPGTCQFRSSISNNFPRIAPRFEQFIPAGRSGWFKVWWPGLFGMTGAVINFNPNTAASAGAFNQGHNLHVLTNTNTAVYTIPVFPPSC